MIVLLSEFVLFIIGRGLGRYKIINKKNNENMPYERFSKYGVQNLTNRDLIAIILRTGSKSMDVLETSDYILDLPAVKSAGIAGLLRLTKEDLQRIPGLGKVKTAQLLSILELSKRIREERAVTDLKLDSSEKIADFYMDRMRSHQTEHVVGVFLDNKLKKIAEETLSVGTINSSLLNEREVFKTALKYNASKIILLHNHPSGDPKPSENDKSVTFKINMGARILSLELVDHIIIGDNCYFSMKEAGIL